MYVSGVELYETFNPGAIYRLGTARRYADDNTIACCGAAAPAEHCASLPVCTVATEWNTIWSGVARGAAAQARIFSPPVCPCAASIGSKQMQIHDL
jgi:hypothetical protein